MDELAAMERADIAESLKAKAHGLYAGRVKSWGEPVARELERIVLLRNVDTKWMDHIDAMDALKQGIYLRSYGQKDPVVEYRLEGFEMFDAMIESIREDTVHMLLTIRVQTDARPQREQVAKPDVPKVPAEPVRREGGKVGRNDPCPCGSGKKYKKCCGR
jgi:preprotein translocase subunit SecA